jgi:hypothetical protein
LDGRGRRAEKAVTAERREVSVFWRCCRVEGRDEGARGPRGWRRCEVGAVVFVIAGLERGRAGANVEERVEDSE